jgi:hypothetical protein
MGQGIQDFYYNAQRRGFARDYQLRVTQIGGTVFNDSDLVFVKTATLPSRKIVVHQVPFQGLQFNVPGSAIYEGSNAWTLTFHATQDFGIRNELERLSLATFDEQKSGPIGKGGKSNLALPGSERMIQLDLVNDKLQIIRTYYLIGCFVTEVGEINYDLQGTGKPLEFKATLAYQYWTRAPIRLNGGIFGKIADIAGKVGDIAGAAGGVARGVGGIFGP